jgi:acyl-CoA ligase (AMP-forming) (exosortase A-associated)
MIRVYPEFTLHHLLRNAAERDPERTAIVEGRGGLTYGELERQSDVLCAAFVEEGVGKGERVGIYTEKPREAVVAMLAASKAGAAFVNINPLLKPPQVHYIAGDCDVRVMVGDSEKLSSLEAGSLGAAFYRGDEPPEGVGGTVVDVEEVFQRGGEAEREVLETDLGAILYTSGSTGMPKGVSLSQRNLVVGAQIVSTYLENTEDDRILSALPFSFDYGLNQLTTTLRVGATLVLQHSRLPGDLMRSLREHRITGLAGVPPLWTLLLRNRKALEEQPLEDLRYITNSGGRIPQANLKELRRLLPHTDIYLMYGLTEAFRSTYLPPEELDRGSGCIGRPIPNTEIHVINEEGQECAPGEVGELVHRGPTVALGYWGKEEETREVFRPSPFSPPELADGERVVYSGDLVWRDEEGYLYFVSRENQMIKPQGYRLSPEEVENLLISSGIVREACAFGLPDQDAGEQVVAVVSLQDGWDESSLEKVREFCINNGPPYMVPKKIVVREELPKTSSGKIDRPRISDEFSDT